MTRIASLATRQGTQKTVLRDSQSAPPPNLLFLRCSHSRMMSCAARASTSGWSCDGSVTQEQRHARTHTPCSDAYPERELHEMCLVLTDDTGPARPERLEEVEEVCRRWTCDERVTQEQIHKSIGTSCTWRARDANGTCSALRAFLLEPTLTLASAPQRVIAKMCVDKCHNSSPSPGAKEIGSGTKMTNSRTVSQPMLVSANRVPIPTYRNSTVRIPIISPL